MKERNDACSMQQLGRFSQIQIIAKTVGLLASRLTKVFGNEFWQGFCGLYFGRRLDWDEKIKNIMLINGTLILSHQLYAPILI